MSLRIGRGGPYRSTRDYTERARGDEPPDSYLERLVKLVPSEVIVAYPVLKGAAAPKIIDWALPLTAWILLAVVIVLRWHATTTPDRGPQWLAIVLSAISFVIWVNVIEGSFGLSWMAGKMGALSLVDWSTSAESQKFLSSLVLVLWTIIVPIIYKGDDQ